MRPKNWKTSPENFTKFEDAKDSCGNRQSQNLDGAGCKGGIDLGTGTEQVAMSSGAHPIGIGLKVQQWSLPS
jgi:hypothetical protein